MKNLTANKEVFKKNLAHLMIEKQYTQEDVAKGIGVAITTVSHWYVGRSLPRGETLIALASFFGVPPSTFLKSGNVFQTIDEERLLNGFRMLSPKGKEKALERIDELKQLYWYSKEQ